METSTKSIIKQDFCTSGDQDPASNILIDPSHQINNEKTKAFFKNFKSIHGWLNILSAKTILWLDFIQKKENIEGNLFEIGVYCGKSAILFGLFANQDKERMRLCDPFKAGVRHNFPQKEVLLKNLNNYFDNLDFIDIYEKESNELTLQEGKNCRLFHIDGGHTIECLTNDLNMADNTIIDKGLIVIDDFFNVGCPEVTEGTYRYLKKGTLSPLMIGFTKIILCKSTMYSWYFEKINTDSWKGYLNDEKVTVKQTKMLNRNILTFLRPNIQTLPTI